MGMMELNALRNQAEPTAETKRNEETYGVLRAKKIQILDLWCFKRPGFFCCNLFIATTGTVTPQERNRHGSSDSKSEAGLLEQLWLAIKRIRRCQFDW